MFALLSQVKFPANIKLIRFFLETKSSVNQGVDELQTKILSQCVSQMVWQTDGHTLHSSSKGQ